MKSIGSSKPCNSEFVKHSVGRKTVKDVPSLNSYFVWRWGHIRCSPWTSDVSTLNHGPSAAQLCRYISVSSWINLTWIYKEQLSKLIVKEPKFWLWVVAKCVRKKLVSWNWCGISDCSVSSICDRDLFSTITFGISNNTITRKRLTFKACISSQNFLIFDYVIHIQDERPSPAAHFFTAYFSNSRKKTFAWNFYTYYVY